MATTLDTMFAELKNSPSTLLPSNFWLAITDEHLKMLEDFGIENLRQTIAHKHFTFGYDGDSKRKAQSKLTKLTSLKCKLKSHTQAKQIQRHKHIYTSHLQNIPVHMEYKSLKRHCYYTNLLYAFFKRVYSEELLNAVSESPVGNPYPIYEKGKLLSEDMINSLIEYSMMKKYVPLSECQQVIEIGAGYGRMAAIFGQLHRECKYVIA
ncbi:MAG: putative sugar O-methyltransferase, partial [Chlamydiae bacterium]|nr:putative sugar O-methyltransferase [Chlamydiota bacterium]